MGKKGKKNKNRGGLGEDFEDSYSYNEHDDYGDSSYLKRNRSTKGDRHKNNSFYVDDEQCDGSIDDLGGDCPYPSNYHEDYLDQNSDHEVYEKELIDEKNDCFSSDRSHIVVDHTSNSDSGLIPKSPTPSLQNVSSNSFHEVEKPSSLNSFRPVNESTSFSSSESVNSSAFIPVQTSSHVSEMRGNLPVRPNTTTHPVNLDFNVSNEDDSKRSSEENRELEKENVAEERIDSSEKNDNSDRDDAQLSDQNTSKKERLDKLHKEKEEIQKRIGELKKQIVKADKDLEDAEKRLKLPATPQCEGSSSNDEVDSMENGAFIEASDRERLQKEREVLNVELSIAKKELECSDTRELMEESSKDANGFQELKGDLKRLLKEINKLKKNKKKLKGELRRFLHSESSFFARFSPMFFVTKGIESIKRLTTILFSFCRRQDSLGEDENLEETENIKNVSNETLNNKIQKNESDVRSGMIQSKDSDFLSEDTVSEDETQVITRDWMKIAYRAAGVTIVATVLLVGGYVGYLFLGYDRTSVKDGGGTVTSTAHNSSETSDPLSVVSSQESGSVTSGFKNDYDKVGGGWWSRIKSKFTSENKKSVAKKNSTEDRSTALKKTKKEKNGTARSKNSSTNTPRDSFTSSYMAQKDAARDELDSLDESVKQSLDGFGDSLTNDMIVATEKASSFTGHFNEDINGLVDETSDSLKGFAGSFTDDISSSSSFVSENSNGFSPDIDLERMSHSDDSLGGIVANSSHVDDILPVEPLPTDIADDSQTELDEESSSSLTELATPPIATNGTSAEGVEIDHETADFAFGNTPVRNETTVPTDFSSVMDDSLDAKVDGLLEDNNSQIQELPNTRTGAEWGTSLVNNTNSLLDNHSVTIPASPINEVVSLQNQTSLSAASSSLPSSAQSDSIEKFNQSEEREGVSLALLNREVASLQPLSGQFESSSLFTQAGSVGNGIDLYVGDASNAELDLNDSSDLNALSGAGNSSTISYDSFEGAPSLLSSVETTDASVSVPRLDNESSFVNSLSNSIANFNDNVEDYAGRLSNTANELRSNIQGRTEVFNNALNNNLTSLQSQATQALETVNNSVTDAANSAEQIRSSLTDSYETLAASLNTTYQNTADSLQNVGNSIRDNFQSLQNSFMNSNETVFPSSGGSAPSLNSSETNDLTLSGSPSTSLTSNLSEASLSNLQENSVTAINDSMLLAAIDDNTSAHSSLVPSLESMSGGVSHEEGAFEDSVLRNSPSSTSNQPTTGLNTLPILPSDSPHGLTDSSARNVSHTPTPMLVSSANSSMTNSASGSTSNSTQTSMTNIDRTVPAVIDDSSVSSGVERGPHSNNWGDNSEQTSESNVTVLSSSVPRVVPSVNSFSSAPFPASTNSNFAQSIVAPSGIPNAGTIGVTPYVPNVVYPMTQGGPNALNTGSPYTTSSGSTTGIVVPSHYPNFQTPVPNGSFANSGVVYPTTNGVMTSGNYLTTVNGVGYREYVTKEGDNLLTIAESELGSSSRWGEIKRLNNLRSGAAYFEPGTRLLLPITSSVAR